MESVCGLVSQILIKFKNSVHHSRSLYAACSVIDAHIGNEGGVEFEKPLPRVSAVAHLKAYMVKTSKKR